MTQDELLAKVATTQASRKQAADEKKAREIAEWEYYQDKVYAYLPKVTELLTLARALFDAKIPIGNLRRAPLMGYDSDLVSDGIHHAFGFVTDWHKGRWQHFNDGAVYPIGIGWEGGGYAGYSFIVTETGFREKHPLPTVADMKIFLQRIDEFEQRVHQYIENLK